MTVTGSNWQQLTLGSMIPALDPDDSDSLIGQTVKEIDRLSGEISDGIQTVANIGDAVTQTLTTVKDLGVEIEALQNEINSLIGNAVNTGIYGHLLGFEPIFGTTTMEQLVNEVRQHLILDINDPNRPIFEDPAARVGGLLLLFSAPSAAELIAQAKLLGGVFPLFKTALEGAGENLLGAESSTQALTSDLFNTLETEVCNLKGVINAFQETPPFTTEPLSQIFPEKGDKDQTETTDPNDWVAVRLSDFIPVLNPNVANSPAKLIVDAERNIVGGAAALLQQASALAASVNQITQAVNVTNRRLLELSQDVTNIIQAVGQTGFFAHFLGLDGSVESTEELSGVAGRALIDIQDTNRPRSRGGGTAFAGLLLVWGAPNPAGLRKKFDDIGSLFQGLKIDVKNVGEVARF